VISVREPRGDVFNGMGGLVMLSMSGLGGGVDTGMTSLGALILSLIVAICVDNLSIVLNLLFIDFSKLEKRAMNCAMLSVSVDLAIS